MMLLPKFPCELQHVDAFVVLDASERFRAEPFLGEKVESGTAHPIVYQRVRARVSSETLLQTFFENLIELELQRMDVSDAGRAWRHPLRLLFSELQEIEIKSAVRNLFRAREPFFGNGEQRKTRRQRQRFLRAREHQVNSERVHVDFHRRK